jgi:F-type H+-transporting ATP synthase subunit e
MLGRAQVVRYSALVGGIGYGVVHRRTLQKREDARAIAAEKKHQEQLKVQAQKEKDQSIIASVRGGAGGGEFTAVRRGWAG